MLVETDEKSYSGHFPINPHSFISEQFINLNKGKVERIVRLIDHGKSPAIGLVAGIRNGILLSPFSAPFGGFHFQKQNIYISEIDNFLKSLQEYITLSGFKKINITLPPDIYHSTFNAKIINSLVRNGFQGSVPEITNWVDLQLFNGSFSQKNSREYYNQAVRKCLQFNIVNTEEEKHDVY